VQQYVVVHARGVVKVAHVPYNSTAEGQVVEIVCQHIQSDKAAVSVHTVGCSLESFSEVMWPL
jgi:hypothetical protein